MTEQTVCLSVPAQAAYARTVRMMAANLAVLCEMSMDEVEDVRMAAEEGFIYACATGPETCDVSFELDASAMRMSFSLGDEDIDEGTDLTMVELLLSSVCDEFDVSEDATELLLSKKVGAHAE